MILIDIYSTEEATTVLYRLLVEREPNENISHRELPRYEDHCAYIAKRPCPYWYLIRHEYEWIGSIYLTQRHEIGVQLFKRWCGKGLGEQAVEELIRVHSTFFANINPANVRSIRFFEKLGFKPLQVTYSRNPDGLA